MFRKCLIDLGIGSRCSHRHFATTLRYQLIDMIKKPNIARPLVVLPHRSDLSGEVRSNCNRFVQASQKIWARKAWQPCNESAHRLYQSLGINHLAAGRQMDFALYHLSRSLGPTFAKLTRALIWFDNSQPDVKTGGGRAYG